MSLARVDTVPYTGIRSGVAFPAHGLELDWLVHSINSHY